MADKKLKETPKEEEIVEVKEETNEYVDNRVKEFLGEDETSEVIEEKEEEVKQEEVIEEKKPEINIEVEREKAKLEARQETIDKIVQTLTGKSTEDLGEEEGFVPAWKKEGRNPKDYDEILEEATRYKEYKDDLKHKEQVKVEAQNQEVQQKNIKQWNEFWDGQINDMTKQGLLPTIEDEKDENDEGVKARKLLFQKMYEINQKAPAVPVTSLKEIYLDNRNEFTSKNNSAKTAPVSAGRTETGAKTDDQFYYEDINKAKTLRDLV